MSALRVEKNRERDRENKGAGQARNPRHTSVQDSIFANSTKFRLAYKRTQLCCWVRVCFRKVAPQIGKVNPSALPFKIRATQIGPRCIRIPREVHCPLTYLPTIQLRELSFFVFFEIAPFFAPGSGAPLRRMVRAAPRWCAPLRTWCALQHSPPLPAGSLRK